MNLHKITPQIHIQLSNFHIDLKTRKKQIECVGLFGSGSNSVGTCPASCQRAESATSAGTHSGTVTLRFCALWEPRRPFRKILRHADIQTTMNIYPQAVTPAKREAASKVADILWRM